MTNNDVLARVRHALDLTLPQIVAIFASMEVELTEDEVRARMGKEEDPEAVFCTDLLLGRLLVGLILERRGPRTSGAPTPPASEELSNNAILKKLRIALKLQEDDMLAVLAAGGQTVSRGELTALFRKPNHKHFRACGDQILRYFLKGLYRRRQTTG